MSTNLLPVIVPTLEPHASTSTKIGRAYKAKKSSFYNTFARELCDDTCHPRWLSASPACSQTFKGTLACFAHTNSQVLIKFNELQNLFNVQVLEDLGYSLKRGTVPC